MFFFPYVPFVNVQYKIKDGTKSLCSSVGRVHAWHAESTRLDPQHPGKLDITAYACNPNSEDTDSGGSGVQGHLST